MNFCRKSDLLSKNCRSNDDLSSLKVAVYVRDADPIYKHALDVGTMRGCAFIVNTKGDLSRTEPRIAEILKYINVGETNDDNEVIKRMCETKDKAFNKEDWTSDMNETDFDRLAWKAEGREENRAEGIATDIAEDRTKKRIAERRARTRSSTS